MKIGKLRKYWDKVKKIKKSTALTYIRCLDEPIDEKLVLLEGGQGSNINGNMFAMLNELQTNPRWNDYKAVFTVTKKTFAKANERMKFYGFDDVQLVIRGSENYQRALACAKYLMTDNTFPPYFNKRDGQVFFNTWHGTPLKTLGKSNKSSLNSLGNVQKNYLMSDYALFPNEFTREVFMKDYDLRCIFSGKSLIANYPRNYIFYDEEAGNKMKNELGYADKKVFAYMPTWRDAATAKEKKRQLAITKNILEEFNKKMPENYVLLVNLHFLLASDINCDGFEKVDYFPSQYDTYEVLNACDGLITDYSSVFFDYAATQRKIILFAYDRQEYLDGRGLYMPFESLPFPIHEDIDSVVKEMSKPTEVSQSFLEEFCPFGWKNSCERLFEMLVTGHTDSYTLTDHSQTEKKVSLLYCGSLPAIHFDSYKKFVRDNPDSNCVVVYRNNLSQEKKEKISQLGDNVSVLGLLNAFQFKPIEFLFYALDRFFGITKFDKYTEHLYEREARRLFYSIKPEKIIDFSNANILISGILSKLSGKKYFALHGEYFSVRPRAAKKIEVSRKIEIEHGFEPLDYSKEENEEYLAADESGLSHKSNRILSKMRNYFPLYFNINGKMVCLSLFSFKTPMPVRLCDTVINVGGNEYKPHFALPTKHVSKKHRGIYAFSLPLQDLENLPATNMVSLDYKDKVGLTVKCHIIYNAGIRRFLGLRGPMCIDKKTETVAIFRQSLKNRLNVYVRSVNVTDSFGHRIKQVIAWCVSKLWNTSKASKLTLLYEKNSSKYEESASVLYEELLDAGYKYSYFIVDKKYEFLDRIPEKYRSNIIYKYTFKHYLYFFKSKTFIGTEALAHAIDLKTFNLLALAKIGSKNINYVFLQHGVMYMVSLNSESRSMFKRKKLNGKYRVVVSSEAEAEHFTTLGRHKPSDLYISGLPKFDRNTRNENADKIVIMPTWRPWEINESRSSFTDTKYFKMIMRIYNAIPTDLLDKVSILPHPLIVNELKKISADISDKIYIGARYDDVLKDTAVLITDYSSIAYDAFYRGARVVFYWEEKDYCMSQYGPSTKLMLNEGNVYGDYVYSADELADVVRRNYDNPQTKAQLKRYSHIVEYHDGKNTQRLIEFLKKDNII